MWTPALRRLGTTPSGLPFDSCCAGCAKSRSEADTRHDKACETRAGNPSVVAAGIAGEAALLDFEVDDQSDRSEGSVRRYDKAAAMRYCCDSTPCTGISTGKLQRALAKDYYWSGSFRKGLYLFSCKLAPTVWYFLFPSSTPIYQKRAVWSSCDFLWTHSVAAALAEELLCRYLFQGVSLHLHHATCHGGRGHPLPAVCP